MEYKKIAFDPPAYDEPDLSLFLSLFLESSSGQAQGEVLKPI